MVTQLLHQTAFISFTSNWKQLKYLPNGLQNLPVHHRATQSRHVVTSNYCAETAAFLPWNTTIYTPHLKPYHSPLNRPRNYMEWNLYWKRINPMVKHSLSLMELHTPSLESTLRQLNTIDTHTTVHFRPTFTNLGLGSTTFPCSFQTTILYTFSSLRERNMTRTWN